MRKVDNKKNSTPPSIRDVGVSPAMGGPPPRGRILVRSGDFIAARTSSKRYPTRASVCDFGTGGLHSPGSPRPTGIRIFVREIADPVGVWRRTDASKSQISVVQGEIRDEHAPAMLPQATAGLRKNTRKVKSNTCRWTCKNVEQNISQQHEMFS